MNSVSYLPTYFLYHVRRQDNAFCNVLTVSFFTHTHRRRLHIFVKKRPFTSSIYPRCEGIVVIMESLQESLSVVEDCKAGQHRVRIGRGFPALVSAFGSRLFNDRWRSDWCFLLILEGTRYLTFNSEINFDWLLTSDFTCSLPRTPQYYPITVEIPHLIGSEHSLLNKSSNRAYNLIRYFHPFSRLFTSFHSSRHDIPVPYKTL